MVIHINHILKKSGKFKIKSALNCKDVAGNTPLHYATKLGFHNLVHEYIKLGADPSLRNDRGEYVLSDNGEIQSPLNPDNFDLYETPQSEIKGDLANFLNNLTVSSMHDSTFRVPVLSDEISIKNRINTLIFNDYLNNTIDDFKNGCEKLDYISISDYALIHNTMREKCAGTRISIDTTVFVGDHLPHVDRLIEYRSEIPKIGINEFIDAGKSENDEIKDNKTTFSHYTSGKIRSINLEKI